MTSEPSPRIRRFDVKGLMAKMALVDEPGALEASRDDPLLRMALEMRRPPNWWGLGLPGEELITISRAEGIPLAWVMPGHVIREVHTAAPGQARLDVLLAAEDDIVAACHGALAECTHRWLADEAGLAAEAVRTWDAGFDIAATALVLQP